MESQAVEPAGRATLRVHGAGVAQEIILDAEALSALGTEALTTETAWTKQPVRFVGVPLAKLLNAAGAKGDAVRAVALNEYVVTFSARDAIEKDAFVAFEMNGKRLSVRDKGPFWIVFPWSQRPELNTGQVQAISIWQLREIEVR